MSVDDAMPAHTVSASPGDTIREAVREMTARDVAAAVVDLDEPGIITARDVLEFVSAGRDPEAERVGDHASRPARTTSPGSPLHEAARTMIDGGFRHLVVRDAERTVGVLAMRDIVRCWIDERAISRTVIPIRRAMNTGFLEVDPEETVERAVRLMSERVVAAVVVAPAGGRSYPGLFTEREVLDSLDGGEDPASERLTDHLVDRMTFSAPGWALNQAAEAMRKGGFQHVVVVDPHEIRGIISMRDVVRAWVSLDR